MIISCSDSRVDPETIFGAKPGKLYVARNIANLVAIQTEAKFISRWMSMLEATP